VIKTKKLIDWALELAIMKSKKKGWGPSSCMNKVPKAGLGEITVGRSSCGEEAILNLNFITGRESERRRTFEG